MTIAEQYECVTHSEECEICHDNNAASGEYIKSRSYYQKLRQGIADRLHAKGRDESKRTADREVQEYAKP